jgi:hypothetical protein
MVMLGFKKDTISRTLLSGDACSSSQVNHSLKPQNPTMFAGKPNHTSFGRDG